MEELQIEGRGHIAAAFASVCEASEAVAASNQAFSVANKALSARSTATLAFELASSTLECAEVASAETKLAIQAARNTFVFTVETLNEAEDAFDTAIEAACLSRAKAQSTVEWSTLKRIEHIRDYIGILRKENEEM